MRSARCLGCTSRAHAGEPERRRWPVMTARQPGAALVAETAAGRILVAALGARRFQLGAAFVTELGALAVLVLALRALHRRPFWPAADGAARRPDGSAPPGGGSTMEDTSSGAPTSLVVWMEQRPVGGRPPALPGLGGTVGAMASEEALPPQHMAHEPAH